MIVITTPLVSMGMLAIVYLGILFANFSRRLGAVTKMSDHTNWFRVASGFVALAGMSQVVRGTAALASANQMPLLLNPWFALATFHIPLAVGVTIDLVVVWYYWRWILREKTK